MDKELDDALCRDFPLLFRDRHAPMTQTCMCWGFDCNRGWEPIIRRAAEKLEPLIAAMPATCFCSHDPKVHQEGKCQDYVNIPYWSCDPLKTRIYVKLISALVWFLRITGIRWKRFLCNCQSFQDDRPAASQIKEKFGRLRLYLTCGTPEMHDICHAAEQESGTVCEDCGAAGKTRGGGWIRTLCDTCYEANEARKNRHD